jgi:hypothetical protein
MAETDCTHISVPLKLMPVARQPTPASGTG